MRREGAQRGAPRASGWRVVRSQPEELLVGGQTGPKPVGLGRDLGLASRGLRTDLLMGAPGSEAKPRKDLELAAPSVVDSRAAAQTDPLRRAVPTEAEETAGAARSVGRDRCGLQRARWERTDRVGGLPGEEARLAYDSQAGPAQTDPPRTGPGRALGPVQTDPESRQDPAEDSRTGGRSV